MTQSQSRVSDTNSISCFRRFNSESAEAVTHAVWRCYRASCIALPCLRQNALQKKAVSFLISSIISMIHTTINESLWELIQKYLDCTCCRGCFDFLAFLPVASNKSQKMQTHTNTSNNSNIRQHVRHEATFLSRSMHGNSWRWVLTAHADCIWSY